MRFKHLQHNFSRKIQRLSEVQLAIAHEHLISRCCREPSCRATRLSKPHTVPYLRDGAWPPGFPRQSCGSVACYTPGGCPREIHALPTQACRYRFGNNIVHSMAAQSFHMTERPPATLFTATSLHNLCLPFLQKCAPRRFFIWHKGPVKQQFWLPLASLIHKLGSLQQL